MDGLHAAYLVAGLNGAKGVGAICVTIVQRTWVGRLMAGSIVTLTLRYMGRHYELLLLRHVLRECVEGAASDGGSTYVQVAPFSYQQRTCILSIHLSARFAAHHHLCSRLEAVW